MFNTSMLSKYFSSYPSHLLTIIFLIVSIIFLLPNNGNCDNEKTSKQKDITSIRVGFWGPTYFSIDQKTYDLNSSFSFGINIDRPGKNRFYTGLAIDLYRVHAKVTDEEVSMINFGFVVKRDYKLKKANLSIRPSITIGLALKSELTFVQKSGHITIKAAADIISNLDKPVSFLIEGGFFWAVGGMENRSKIYSFPAPILRAGLMF